MAIGGIYCQSREAVRDRKLLRFVHARGKLRVQTKRYSAMIKIMQDQNHAELEKKLKAELGGVRSKSKKSKKGRKERWPGHCVQCLMQWLHEGGGRGHSTTLCKATMAAIRKTRRTPARSSPDSDMCESGSCRYIG